MHLSVLLYMVYKTFPPPRSRKHYQFNEQCIRYDVERPQLFIDISVMSANWWVSTFNRKQHDVSDAIWRIDGLSFFEANQPKALWTWKGHNHNKTFLIIQVPTLCWRLRSRTCLIWYRCDYSRRNWCSKVVVPKGCLFDDVETIVLDIKGPWNEFS